MAQPTPQPIATERLRRGRLLRVLGVSFGLAVTVGNTIGAGILRTPGEVAARLPTGALFLAVWVAGGLYALLCSFSLAEVATLTPRSGGHYVYARYTFGDYVGFVVGWSDWVSTCGATAAVAIIVGEYSGMLLPLVAGQARGLAILAVLFFALLQWCGVRWGSRVQQVTTLLKAIGFLAVVAACWLYSGGSAPATIQVAAPRGAALLAAIVLSLEAVIYTYDGWTGVIYFSEEVHQPGRDIPRSMFGGIAAVTIIYVLLNAALLHVFPVTSIAGDPLPLGSAVRLMWGAYADRALEALVIVSMLSAINAFQLMACRILFAMSRDRLFVAMADRVNSGGTPDAGLWLSTIVAIAFIATGTFDKVIAVVAFFFVFNYIAGQAATLVLRRREPEKPRPYRAFGYPWTTIAGLCGSLAFLAGAITHDTRNSLYAVAVLAASYPVFRLVKTVARESR